MPAVKKSLKSGFKKGHVSYHSNTRPTTRTYVKEKQRGTVRLKKLMTERALHTTAHGVQVGQVKAAQSCRLLRGLSDTPTILSRVDFFTASHFLLSFLRQQKNTHHIFITV